MTDDLEIPGQDGSTKDSLRAEVRRLRAEAEHYKTRLALDSSGFKGTINKQHDHITRLQAQLAAARAQEIDRAMEIRRIAFEEAAQHLETDAAATLKRVTDRAMFVLAAHVVRSLATAPAAKPTPDAKCAMCGPSPRYGCPSCGTGLRR